MDGSPAFGRTPTAPAGEPARMPPTQAASSPGPLLVVLVVVALLLSTSVQAWQLLHGGSSDGAGRLLVVNVTAPAPMAAPAANASEPAPVPPAPSAPPAPAGPAAVERIEAPKYVPNVDFKWEAHLSSTPLLITPWTGNGVPYLNVYYEGLKDSGMFHNGWAYESGYIGFDLCELRILRYTNFTAVPGSEATGRFVYQALPFLTNPYNFLGSGEMCFARATVASYWQAQVCMEGDGVIAKPWTETEPDGTVVLHSDYMDDCKFIKTSFGV